MASYKEWVFANVTCAAVLCSFSCVQLFVTPWSIAHQAPLSMEFSRQEHWRMSPFPVPGELPHQRIKPAFPILAAIFFTTELPEKSLEPTLFCKIL